jgi:hypothetical protein
VAERYRVGKLLGSGSFGKSSSNVLPDLLIYLHVRQSIFWEGPRNRNGGRIES